jgi:hypothetical protein
MSESQQLPVADVPGQEQDTLAPLVSFHQVLATRHVETAKAVLCAMSEHPAQLG